MFSTDPARRKRRWLFVPIFIVVALTLLSALVMLLWNSIVVPVFALPALQLWQAGGLLLLCRLLFGGFRFRPRAGRFGPPPQMRDRWLKMNEQQRAHFRSEWRKRCDPDQATDDN
jgi:hypothetical protein